jgi:hypothetical protein
MNTRTSLRYGLGNWIQPIPEMSASEYYLRCLWVVVQLVAAYCFANEASPFFYQQF